MTIIFLSCVHVYERHGQRNNSVEDTPQARNLHYKLVSCVLLKLCELLFDIVIAPASIDDNRSYALSPCSVVIDVAEVDELVDEQGAALVDSIISIDSIIMVSANALHDDLYRGLSRICNAIRHYKTFIVKAHSIDCHCPSAIETSLE